MEHFGHLSHTLRKRHAEVDDAPKSSGRLQQINEPRRPVGLLYLRLQGLDELGDLGASLPQSAADVTVSVCILHRSLWLCKKMYIELIHI